jgi:Fe-S cluster biogenesis protein NfuA
VAAVEEGVVRLEATGSPGAVLPLLSRIEALLRSALPQVREVRLSSAPSMEEGDLLARVKRILDDEVNPAVASHGGRVYLAGVGDGRVHIRLEGGCQGCSAAQVTVRQGIEPLLRARIPELVAVVDVTDHAAGTSPFYAPGKR